jgi:hypothetical protein
MQQVALTDGAPPEVVSHKQISVDELSALMDQYSVPTFEPSLPAQPTLIDTFGYSVLVETCYYNLVAKYEKLEKLFSFPEFALTMGWYLYKKVFRVFQSVTGKAVHDFDKFAQSLPDIELPCIIADYIDQLGTVMLSNGQLTFPVLALPVRFGEKVFAFKNFSGPESDFTKFDSRFYVGGYPFSDLHCAMTDDEYGPPAWFKGKEKSLEGTSLYKPFKNMIFHVDDIRRKAYVYNVIGACGAFSERVRFSANVITAYRSMLWKLMTCMKMRFPRKELHGQATYLVRARLHAHRGN